MHRTPFFFAWLSALMAVVVTILMAGCGDDDEGPPTSGSPPPQATATAAQPTSVSPAPTQVQTGAGSGIGSVDAAMKLIAGRDPGALAAAVRLTEMTCASNLQGAGGPPRCQAGEQDGQRVKVFPWSGCEFEYAREGAVSERLKVMVVDRQLSPVAVVRLAQGSRLAYFEGERYGVIYEDAGGRGLMVGLTEDGKITRLSQGCQAPPEELIGRVDPSAVVKRFK